ncbi:MAG TPA: hypothetical protein VGY97_06100 [Solirubrobacteraceae bacterium]|jgi:hypothetical protein|nr:hypothetical protein [Solirubrobacteraceae bacterium]
MIVLAQIIGSDALYLLYAWLLSAAVAGYLSDRKGYGEKWGLASGMLLFVIGPIVWLLWPPRPNSKWSTAGIFGSRIRAERARRSRGDDRSGPAG